MTKITNLRATFMALIAAGAVSLGACDASLFDVKNPGRILDDDLNTAEGVNALVTGMSSDFSASYDDLTFMVARLTDELVGSGSYFSTGRLRRGLFDSEDSDGYWNGVQRARWVAEGGLIRMAAIEGYTFENNPNTARAYLFAGMANRWFGENFCEVVFSKPYTDENPGPAGEVDTGAPLPRSAAFTRAIPALTAAVSHGNGAGADDIVNAARGTLAQVYVGLGDWQNALNFAAQVPTDFVYSAEYSSNSGREESQVYNETHRRSESSAIMTTAGTVGANDPRTPWTNCYDPANGCSQGIRNGADGTTPHYRQDKYATLDDDIPVVKGTEMRLIEAEAALLNGDLGTFIAKINDVRTFWELDPIDPGAVTGVGSLTGDPETRSAHKTSMNGWDILDRERSLTNWLEGRRLWDLHRWDHPYLTGGGIIYETTVARRASCLPISDQECQVNENVDSSKCFTI